MKVKKSKALAVLKALEEARERGNLGWAEVAEGVGVSRRTLMNSCAWLRDDGGHPPCRRTLRSMAKWLRTRGVFVGIA